MENKLQIIVDQSGLEPTKAKHILGKFTDYFLLADEWTIKARAIVVTDASQVAEMEMARVGRLFLREKRIAIETARKALKEQALREGKAIDGISNVLKALIIPIEEHLKSQENFVKIKEAEKAEADRIEAERKIEEERLENERLLKLTDERRMEALPYSSFWTADYDFRIMSEANFRSVMGDLSKKKRAHYEEQEKVRLENERLQKEAEEKEKQLEQERITVEKEKRLAQEKAQKEKDRIRKKAEAKAWAEKEKVEKDKAEAERIALEERERIQREADLKAKVLKAKAGRERIAIEVKAMAKLEGERKEKERLAELLKNQIECPKCGHRFQNRGV